MTPFFKNVLESYAAKNYQIVFLHFVVSNFFEKLVNDLFSHFQYGCRYSQSTSDLLHQLTLVFDRMARIFTKSEATRAVPLNISKTFGRFWLLAFFTNLSLIEFWVRYLALFNLFYVKDSFEWFWMGSLCKNI